MTEQYAERTYLSSTRWWFPEGVAPFGELNLMRADHGSDGAGALPGRIGIDATLEIGACRVIKEAWGQSEWLKSELDDKSLDDFIEGTDWTDFDAALVRGIIGATHRPREKGAWFAIRPPSGEADSDDTVIKELGQFIMPSQVVGFASAKHDVSGSPFQQLVKRLKHPEKIYAAVSDVDVMPAEQRKHIGSALLYASLGLFRPEQHPTTYVAASNPTLIEKLGSLGYQPTGSHIRKDLVPGAEIEEVRLQAQSVSEVRGELAAEFPWLKQVVPAYAMWHP